MNNMNEDMSGYSGTPDSFGYVWQSGYKNENMDTSGYSGEYSYLSGYSGMSGYSGK